MANPIEPDFNSFHERRIDSEWAAQKAEGKRKQREYEGIDMATLALKGGVVGTHKMPSIEAVAQLWADGVPVITTYTPANKDLEGLVQELEDLERDIELIAKWSGVDYYDYE